ncbi:MAG: Gfo/Idh/MocA family protein [Bacteriovoracia bacterium]
MTRLAILGSDSSHVEAFTKLIHFGPFQKEAKVVSIYGDDRSQAESKAKELSIEKVCTSIDDAIASVDAVLVLGRFPESHFRLAQKPIEKGLPTFIDKPFVSSLKDADTLIELSKKNNTPVMSASAYRFSTPVNEFRKLVEESKFSSGVMTGPRECNDLGPDPRFKDLFFYGIHLVEAHLQIFGDGITKIVSSSSDRGTFVSLTYSNGFHCALNFLSGLPGEFYHAIAYGAPPVEKTFYLDKEEDLYEKEVSAILKFFQTRTSPISLESSRRAVEIIEEIKKAEAKS